MLFATGRAQINRGTKKEIGGQYLIELYWFSGWSSFEEVHKRDLQQGGP
jgi:hypothetical protein